LILTPGFGARHVALAMLLNLRLIEMIEKDQVSRAATT
jgi:hypothetical protein